MRTGIWMETVSRGHRIKHGTILVPVLGCPTRTMKLVFSEIVPDQTTGMLLQVKE